MPSLRWAGLLTALATGPIALAYRFAIVYRARAGFPARRPPQFTPADFGLSYEATVVKSSAGLLPAWFIPARGGASGPGIVLVHGWESARDRALPNVRFLNAAGFHCLVFDVRGHGENPAEALPISGGEFGADATAAFRALVDRPEVTRAAIVGHSMGGVGAILAAATEPRIAAVVSASAPSEPRLLVRQTFRLARLPIPAPLAHPLAVLTSHVYVRPRGHTLRSTSARHAIGRYRGPVLIAHGAMDDVMPVSHALRLAEAARRTRGTGSDAPVELLLVPDGRHTWLYEDAGYRRTVARFLSQVLGGPYPPDEAADRAGATEVERLPTPNESFAALADRLGSTSAGGTATHR